MPDVVPPLPTLEADATTLLATGADLATLPTTGAGAVLPLPPALGTLAVFSLTGAGTALLLGTAVAQCPPRAETTKLLIPNINLAKNPAPSALAPQVPVVSAVDAKVVDALSLTAALPFPACAEASRTIDEKRKQKNKRKSSSRHPAIIWPNALFWDLYFSRVLISAHTLQTFSSSTLQLLTIYQKG